MRAQGLLKQAAEIMDVRAKEYDKPDGERSVAAIVAAYNAITGESMTEARGWLFLMLLKQVRLFSRIDERPHLDSAKDLIAYAALLGECAFKQYDTGEGRK